MSSERYPADLNPLLSYGDCRHMPFDPWPDYVKELRLGDEQVPDLIRMATDEELYKKEPEDLEFWAPVHAWRAIAQLKAEAAIEPFLSLLDKQNDSDDWEWIDAELPEVYAAIGIASIPALKGYLADSSRGLYPRSTALLVLTRIAQRHPDVLSECIAALIAQLESESDAELNGFIIDALLDLNAIESAPAIERAFAENRVDETLVGTWDNVQVELGLKEPDGVSKPKQKQSFIRRISALDKQKNTNDSGSFGSAKVKGEGNPKNDKGFGQQKKKKRK